MINNITSQMIMDHLLSPYNSIVEGSEFVDITSEKAKHVAFAAILAVGAAFFAISAGSATGLLFAIALGAVSLYATTAISKLRVIQEKISGVQQETFIPQEQNSHLTENQLPHSRLPLNSDTMKSPPILNNNLKTKEAPKTAPPTTKISKVETDKVEAKAGEPKLPKRVSLRLLSEEKYKSELKDLSDVNRSIDAHGNTLLHYAFLFGDDSGKGEILAAAGVNASPVNKKGETPLTFIANQKKINAKPKIPPQNVPAPTPPVTKAPIEVAPPPLPINAEDLLTIDEVHETFETSENIGEEILDDHGNTLLHYAHLYEQTEMVDRIAQEMVSKKITAKPNKYGETPQDFAKKYKHFVFEM